MRVLKSFGPEDLRVVDAPESGPEAGHVKIGLEDAPEAFRRVVECTDGVIKTVIRMGG